MEFELKQLLVENGIDEYNMLQEIDANEYGFTNEVNGMSFEEYKKWLIREEDYSNSLNLPENYIPQTMYFLCAAKQPIEIARIRHYSSEFLEKQGVGNFGYGIAKPHRGEGYGNVLFVNVLTICKSLGYSKIKSFVHINNVASNNVFVNADSIFLGTFNGTKNVYETIIN